MYTLPQTVLDQKKIIPEIYGKVDFSVIPERYTDDIKDKTALLSDEHRADLLANEPRMDIIRKYTMMGDKVADAYAVLIPKYGFKKLVQMLEQACDEGLEHVENAPEELKAFIRSMERTPDWVDMDIIEEGARLDRVRYAHIVPYVIKGALLATFMNSYAALPMAMTGTFSSSKSVGRIQETANFFTLTTMPGTLQRFGAGFKSCAKVRLMHSMVRFHALRTDRWDVSVYGIPIPQVDQMPAGMSGMVFMSRHVLKKGRTEFTPAEFASVQLARYKCFLLGLPEELLPTTPQEILDVFMTRKATLRYNWDDATSGELLKSTLGANFASGKVLKGAFRQKMEGCVARYNMVNTYCGGDYAMAEKMGVTISKGERRFAKLGLAALYLRLKLFDFFVTMPITKNITDKYLVKKINGLMKGYGHANFESDASVYKPSGGAS